MPTSRLRPADDVHVAWLDGELVFLDLSSGQFCGAGPELAAAVLWAFSPHASQEPEGAAELLGPLIGSLLVTAPAEANTYVPASPVGERKDVIWRPVGGEIIEDPRPTTLWRTIVATRLLHRVDQILFRSHAGALIQELRLQRQKAKVTVGHRCKEIPSLVEAHIRARMLYPRTTFCLAGAAALAMHAWARGIAVRIVIGVQPKPFYSHAWVEYDGKVVSDVPDAGNGLAPILAID